MAITRTDIGRTVTPAGVIVPFAGTNVPSNWLLCDGTLYDQSIYANLATTLGYSNSWSAHVLALSPEGFWRMNDSSGNFTDSSGNSRTLTQAGTAPTYQQNGAITGDSDKSILFNASAYGSRAIWNTSITNVTLAVWVNLSDTSRHGTAVYNGTATGGGPPYNGYGIGVGNTNTATDGNNVIVHYHGITNFSGGPIGTGWHLIAMTLDASSVLTIWRDGEQVYTQSATSPTTPASSFWVGSTATYSTTEANYGIDEVMFFGTALSAVQHKALYAAGLRKLAIPDMRGRVPVGLDNIGGSDAGRLSVSNDIGLTDGTETHTLTTSELASHTHSVTDPGHAHSVWTGGDAYNVNAHNGGAGISAGNNTNAASTGISIQNSGSGGAHQNTQPTMVLNYIIST